MATRLGTLWFVLMAAVGCFNPYYGLYLKQVLNLSATQVGAIIAVMPLVGFFAQPIWGQVADRTGARRPALALALVGAALGAFAISRVSAFAGVLLATAFFALSMTSVIPMATAVSLAALPSGTQGFGRVRMFGTLGYLAAVALFPWLSVRLAGSDGSERLSWLFALTAACAIPAAALVMRLPPLESLGLRAKPGEFRRVLAHPPLRRLLFFAFFSNLAMQGPINLFPVLLASRGGTVEDLRSAWIFMLALEIPLVGFAGVTLRRLGPRGLLLMGLLGEGMRWTATAFVPALGATLGLQLFHGLSAMGILIGIPLYLELSIPASLRSSGQTVIAACGLGLGSIVSISAAGWLYDRLGSYAPFLAGGLVALSLSAALFFILPAPYKPEEEHPPCIA